MSDSQRPQRLRIFCAAELPPDVRARAAAHLTRLRETAQTRLKISWERAEKLHLTLKFLGEIDAARIEDVSRAARRAAESSGACVVSLQEAGAFPPRGNARVLWLGLRDEAGRLAHLHEQLETQCARENFPRETRAFHPHITIARIRIPNDAARRLAQLHTETEFEPVRFLVTEIVVIHSQPGAGGSRYTPLSRHTLNIEAGGELSNSKSEI
ncbi:MAG: RNA 2',3'-cyclic phosphodiesterase [Pyrinomonadaceae bacterium]